MSIRFASARTPRRLSNRSPIARAQARRSISQAANDNGDTTDNDNLLRAALRHFSEHGLGAARMARAQAEQAFFAGDREGYDRWLDITRTLDRRIAVEAEHRVANSELA